MKTATYQLGGAVSFPRVEMETYTSDDWDELASRAGFSDPEAVEIETLLEPWGDHPAGSHVIYERGAGYFVIAER